MELVDRLCCLCKESIGPHQSTVPEYNVVRGEVVSGRDVTVVVSGRLRTHYEDMYLPEGKCKVEIPESVQPEVIHQSCWELVKREWTKRAVGPSDC